MDEVHIAQFAALLRTLSKQHGRQIVVAVHEKPLFDYLSIPETVLEDVGGQFTGLKSAFH